MMSRSWPWYSIRSGAASTLRGSSLLRRLLVLVADPCCSSLSLPASTSSSSSACPRVGRKVRLPFDATLSWGVLLASPSDRCWCWCCWSWTGGDGDGLLRCTLARSEQPSHVTRIDAPSGSSSSSTCVWMYCIGTWVSMVCGTEGHSDATRNHPEHLPTWKASPQRHGYVHSPSASSASISSTCGMFGGGVGGGWFKL